MLTHLIQHPLLLHSLGHTQRGADSDSIIEGAMPTRYHLAGTMARKWPSSASVMATCACSVTARKQPCTSWTLIRGGMSGWMGSGGSEGHQI